MSVKCEAERVAAELEHEAAIGAVSADNANYVCPVTIKLAREAAALLRQQAEALAEANEWKASALQSLAHWHALGDALLPFAPGKLGAHLPTHLLETIPKALAEKDAALAKPRLPDPRRV